MITLLGRTTFRNDHRPFGILHADRRAHILGTSLLALLDQPQATLADVLRLLSDDDYRRAAMAHVRSVTVRAFWLREYKGYPARFRAETIAPVQNKVGAFLANPLLHQI